MAPVGGQGDGSFYHVAAIPPTPSEKGVMAGDLVHTLAHVNSRLLAELMTAVWSDSSEVRAQP